jgi:hypothetical protein
MKPVGPELPLACSLDAAAFAEREARWRALSARALVGRERLAEGVRLRYRAGAAEELRELVRLEGECCAFLDLRLAESAEHITLEVSGPPEAAEIVEAFGGDV